MGLSHSPKIVTDSLYLYLDAANPKSYPGSGSLWYDLSGNRNHATIFNSPTWDNTYFTIVSASSQRFTVPYKSQWRMIGSNSISYWSTDSSNAGGVIVGYQKGGWEGYLLQPDTTTYSATSGSNDYSVGISRTAGEWALITFVVDRTAGFYYTYKNSSLVGSKAIAQPDLSAFSAGELQICSNNGIPGRQFGGKISMVNFYTKALSADEVRQNFNALRGRYGL